MRAFVVPMLGMHADVVSVAAPAGAAVAQAIAAAQAVARRGATAHDDETVA